MEKSYAKELRELAVRYETADFLPADPAWFMHQVGGKENQETMAFLASCISYGNRKQFMPKIQYMLDCSGGNVYEWIKSGAFKSDIPDDENRCFYRLYTFATMHRMMSALQTMLNDYGSMGAYIATKCGNSKSCYDAVCAITSFFAHHDPTGGIVPKNAVSACKRVCMFIRWMVRDNSPVDLGLWSDIIDKRTLIIPMDTHVLQQAVRLGIMQTRTASMSSAIKLSSKLSEIFPDDPMKGDFALFGYGVNAGK